MANKPLDAALLDRAIMFAVRAHAGTERTPYGGCRNCGNYNP